MSPIPGSPTTGWTVLPIQFPPTSIFLCPEGCTLRMAFWRDDELKDRMHEELWHSTNILCNRPTEFYTKVGKVLIMKTVEKKKDVNIKVIIILIIVSEKRNRRL
jgi:hypothetical protein